MAMSTRRKPKRRKSKAAVRKKHVGPKHITRKQFEALKKANLAERRAASRKRLPGVEPDATRVTPRGRRRDGSSAATGGLATTAAAGFDSVAVVNLSTPVRTQPDGDDRCIAYAVAAGMEAAICRTNQTSVGAPEISVQDVFASQGAQVGAIDTIQVAVVKGVVDATCFPEGAAGRCTNPGPHTFFAKVTAIGGPQNKRVQAMRTALETRGPLVTLVEIFSNFTNFAGGTPYNATGPSAGFHAMCILGFEVDADGSSGRWIAKNSMGTGWGDNGFVRIPWREPRVRPEDVVYVVENVHQ